jgi:hypothetical protein
VPTIGPGLGNVISANALGDYNTIQAAVAKVLGPPNDLTPRYGYNQSVASSQVAVGNKVTLSHWLNLRTDAVKARGHQTGSSSEANNISIPTSLNLITEAVRLEYFNYAVLVDTYRDTLGTGQFTIDTVSVAQRLDDWNGNLANTITMNFGDNATIRAFFNAGGVVKFNVGMTGTFNSFSTLKDNSWTEMFTQMGTITMDRTSTYLDAGSSGSPSANIGYFNLTNTDQPIFVKSPLSGNYTANQFKILAKISLGTVIFTIQYNDITIGANTPANGPNFPGTSAGTPGGFNDEYIDGQITQTVIIHRPAGSYVSVASPTTTLTGDFQSGGGAVFGLVASNYVVNEGSGVTVTLNTRNMANGAFVTYYCSGSISYTVNGITNSRFSNGSTDSYFTVISTDGGKTGTATISLVVANNLYTDGDTNFTLQLYNGLASTTIYINDTSKTPTGIQRFFAVGTSQFTAPPGVRTVSVLLIGGGGGGGAHAGGGGGAGDRSVITTNVIPGGVYNVVVGNGGAAGVAGSGSSFGAFSVGGGAAGGSGSSTGTGANSTNTGGGGGVSGNGNSGGLPFNNSGAAVEFLHAGGGGAGEGNNGQNATSRQGGAGAAGVFAQFYPQITDNERLWVCGGGGGGSVGPGGFGGGGNYQAGNGGTGAATGTGGGANSGSGGGGGGVGISAGTIFTRTASPGYAGGAGGSGLVYIAWP